MGVIARVVLLGLCVSSVSVARAQAPALGPPLDEQRALSREDGRRERPEGYREVVLDDRTPFPYGVMVLGEARERLYINLDGTVGLGESAWVTQADRSAHAFGSIVDPRVVIAPFSARVADADGAACGEGAAHRVFVAAERERLIVTWNAMLRPGDRCGAGAPSNTVQLVLYPDVRDEDARPECMRAPRSADPCFVVEFRYVALAWAEYCVDPAVGCEAPRRAFARVGLDALGRDFELSVPQSGTPAVAYLHARSNVGETGVWRFEVVGGALPPDRDADGRPDGADNCIEVPDPGQSNVDGDVFGDACDADSDDDDVLNCDIERCPGDADGGDNDLDGAVDEYGECVASTCYPRQDRIDSDSDDSLDEVGEEIPARNDQMDNCPLVVNPGQENRDGGPYGDACDPPDEEPSLLERWIEAIFRALARIRDFIVWLVRVIIEGLSK